MPEKHAILSPSAAHRWMHCTPSVRLEMKLKSGGEYVESPEAREGTLAHSLAELMLKRLLRRIREKDYEKQLEEIRKDYQYSQSMYDYCEEYAAYVINLFHNVKAEHPSAQIYLEQEIDLTKYVTEGFGTADLFIVADGTLIYIDLKYGKGVPVYADNNPQCMIYVVGILIALNDFYNIFKIKIVIYQPRIDNTNSWDTTADHIFAWAESELKVKALMAWNGLGDFVAGEHCKFCIAKTTCRANAEYYTSLGEIVFKPPELLEDFEIAEVLSKLKGLKDFSETIANYALEQAKKGKRYPGFKLVEGKSDRYYADLASVIKTLQDSGYEDSEIYKPKEVIGITAMEKLLGKSDFGALLNDFIKKPKGNPTLVPESDKRRPWDPSEDAAQKFDDL